MLFDVSLRLSSLSSTHVEADFYPAGMAVLARLAEGLEQALTNALTSHLNQAKARNFSNLMLGAVAT
jgi:hypothetical protein